jgi:nucleoside-diphosphate-sugar epimerase
MNTTKIETVLVTGGGGYKGAVLVPKLLEKGYSLKVLDWFLYGNPFRKAERVKGGGERKNFNQLLTCIRGDIRDETLLEKELKGVDAVIHLACISNDPSFDLDPHLGKSVNFDATIRLFEIAKKAGVKRFVYISTSSVYGVKDENKVTEKLSLEPLTDYSKYKAICELYLLPMQSNDFTVLILRPATVCGYSPRMRLDLTVNMLTIQALVNREITVFGGSQKRPNIHIEDITDLYVKTLEYPSKMINGKIYNAGYENYSVMKVAEMVKEVLKDKRIKIKVLPTNDLRSYKISSEKIKKDLGYEAKHSVEEAIGDIVKAYNTGLLPDPLTNDKYVNIKMMKEANIK